MSAAEVPTLTRALLVNGFVLGTDQDGQQIPEFCGPFTEVAKRIEEQGVTIERRSLAMLKGDGK